MRIAITGHRPDKLGGYDANNPLRVRLRNRFKDVLVSLVADALTFRGAKPQDIEVYVGGALGFDTDAARVCVEVAVPTQDGARPGVKTIISLPFCQGSEMYYINPQLVSNTI
jgi:uncharacterized phage-like protein YoqJ